MTEQHGTEHHGLGQHLGFGLDHQHRVLGAGDDEIELRGFQFSRRRIEDVVAILVTNFGSTDRAEERNTGQRQRCRRAEQCRDVAVDFRVQRHHRRNDLDFVEEAIGKQGAQRTIDQTRGQRFLLGRSAFALEEATGHAATGVELLLVVDGEREEVLVGLRILLANHRDEHHGLIDMHHHRATGLAGDGGGFERYIMLAVAERLFDGHGWRGRYCHGLPPDSDGENDCAAI